MLCSILTDARLFADRLLMEAMGRFGCAVGGAAAWRHFVCEECAPGVEGGFDVAANQVVVCHNQCAGDPAKVAEVAKHELVHMYDHCVARVDFEDPAHLACTEVRAANLAQCRSGGLLSRSRLVAGGSHRDCVRERAARSVAVIRGVGPAEAAADVEAVFERCYADLEPLGRRPAGPACERLAADELGGFLRATGSERRERLQQQQGRKEDEEEALS